MAGHPALLLLPLPGGESLVQAAPGLGVGGIDAADLLEVGDGGGDFAIEEDLQLMDRVSLEAFDFFVPIAHEVDANVVLAVSGKGVGDEERGREVALDHVVESVADGVRWKKGARVDLESEEDADGGSGGVGWSGWSRF